MHNHKNRNFIIIGIVILAIASTAGILFFSRHAETYSTVSVQRRNLTAIVRATGTITPDQESTLSFSAQGKIATVNVHEGDMVHTGDVLATLDAGTIQAQLDGALADEQAAEAQLSKLQAGARPVEIDVYSQKYNDASTALITAMNDAYLQSYDAITNKADSLFINGNSVNPTINIRTQSQTEYSNINQERVNLNDTLSSWKNTLAQLSSIASTSASSSDALQNARTVSKSALTATQIFLSDLSSITGNLSTGNSGLAQSIIDADMAMVNGADQEVTGASTAFSSADANWSSARDSYTLETSGSRNEDISAGAAALAKAQAEVEGYESALSQSKILAPFDGTITDVNMKIGEVVVPGISSDENIGIINTSVYNIDTYVPENSIGAMSVGNPADITMDAYGSGLIFPAHVYLVSPAETVMNGANSYKVTLRFDQPDTRIRSGLTVNAVITTATSTGALAVPTRAIITKNDQKFVLIQSTPTSSTFTEQQVTTGIASSDGYTEILSGLNEGDIVASFGDQNY